MTDTSKFHFLCTRNSCRWQMAEGWGKHFAAGRIEVQSARIEGRCKDPRAIAVMAEADISCQESTRVTQEMIDTADVVGTVCGHDDEHYPPLPAAMHKIHRPLNDPARAAEAEIMEVFTAARDDIREWVRCALVAERVAH